MSSSSEKLFWAVLVSCSSFHTLLILVLSKNQAVIYLMVGYFSLYNVTAFFFSKPMFISVVDFYRDQSDDKFEDSRLLALLAFSLLYIYLLFKLLA